MGDKNRSTGIDILKCLCAFMVICIHTPYPGKELAEPFTRIAVPVFFMISGYYYSSLENSRRTQQQLKRIGIMTAFSSVLYIVGKLALEMLTSRSPIQLIGEWTSGESWISFLVFNRPPYSTHLWYLAALLYVLLIVKVIGQPGNRRKLYFLIPVLFCCNFIVGNYSLALFGVQLPTHYSRNFLLTGLPCFLLGDCIYANRSRTLRPGLLVLLLMAAALLTQVEKSFFVLTDTYGNKDFFVGTLFMSWAAFLLARHDFRIYDHPVAKGIAFCGRKLSTGVYIIHPMVGSVVNKIAEFAGQKLPVIDIIFPYVRVLVVAAVSAALTAAFLAVKEKAERGWANRR